MPKLLSTVRRRLRGRALDLLLPSPIVARHVELSLLASLDDDPARPSQHLLDLSIAAIAAARGVSLDGRLSAGGDYAALWPGEHYALLAGLVRTLEPRLVVEIGTGAGSSAIAMKPFLPPDGRIVTFDLVDWRSYPESRLEKGDFADGRLVQEIDDLSDAAVARRHAALLGEAELVFVDAAKDGLTERRLLANLEEVGLRASPIVVFDDIRLWNMLAIWRHVRRPKLDLTSFGHWSGTGLVDWHGPGGADVRARRP